MRHVLLFLELFLCLVSIDAQRLTVESFTVKGNDLTARTHPRRDINGNDCALIKVQLASSGAVFEGNVIGDVSYNTSEYLVYMAQGSRRLTVKLEGYLPLEVNFQDYNIAALETKTVYQLIVTGVVSGNQQEPARISTGWIVLESVPSEASVYINNEYVGKTPLSNYKQSYGTYQCRLEHPNYHPWSGVIELNSGRYEKSITLSPAFGTIEVTSSVAGAEILLDGRPTGKFTPGTLTEVPSGNHTIVVQKDKYAPRQQEVTVNDGQTARLTVSLDARFARVNIQSLQNAQIYCNGNRVGTGRYSEDMMEGYYDIEVRLDHHQSATRQIQVVAGRPQDITLNPVPKYGSLDVTSTPHNATVKVDGNVVGKTPVTVEQLLEGDHTIKVSLNGGMEETRTVSITENETARIDIVINTNATAQSGGGQAQHALCPDNNHPHMIDLGLPSGTKWACCNVGASKPWDYGDMFAWGETSTKNSYDWSTYRWCYGSETTQRKYNTKRIYGTVDNRTQLELSDDAARSHWGRSWRMPTIAELTEMKDNCTFSWTTVNGVKGAMFTSRVNGHSVFLPAAGWSDGALFSRGESGSYWSLSLYESRPSFACSLYFSSGGANMSNGLRAIGRSLRPVIK